MKCRKCGGSKFDVKNIKQKPNMATRYKKCLKCGNNIVTQELYRDDIKKLKKANKILDEFKDILMIEDLDIE